MLETEIVIIQNSSTKLHLCNARRSGGARDTRSALIGCEYAAKPSETRWQDSSTFQDFLLTFLLTITFYTYPVNDIVNLRCILLKFTQKLLIIINIDSPRLEGDFEWFLLVPVSAALALLQLPSELPSEVSISVYPHLPASSILHVMESGHNSSHNWQQLENSTAGELFLSFYF